ncbi:hypothetical protein [Clostridium scatologenes]|uniref:Uncharacterized protein n=1 Tax=Clostridium scatologenes TaxID=1548 RepID=A0A0E3GSN2_CLOSL|nr:hypothetical protein [Clostridium scatologenes]AKA72366.1 hypothetical protein CSCA_5241 [Clostridium scatologenes]
MSNSYLSFRKFAINLYEEDENHWNYTDLGTFIEDMTKRYCEIALVMGINLESLKVGGKYRIFDEDKEFIKWIILHEYGTENMVNVRRESFDIVNCNYIDNIINGFKKIILNVSTEKELEEQLYSIEHQTKNDVRRKCLEIEDTLTNILKELQEYRSDKKTYVCDHNELISNLKLLHTEINYGYERFTHSQNSYPDAEFTKAVDLIIPPEDRLISSSKDNNEEREINWLVTLKCLQNKGYIDLKNKIYETCDKIELKKNRDAKIRAIQKKIDTLSNSIREDVLNMSAEDREAIIQKTSSDYRKLLLNGK